LRYQRLTSDMKSGNSAASLVQHQRVQYLGIPVTLLWHQPLGRWFNTYLSATVAIDLPLRSTLESAYDIGGNMIDPTSERLHPGMLWSIGLGAGLQYNPVPQLGFFVEPTLLHYFNNSSNVETWNTAHPVVFSLPIGLRITF
jgi:RNA polymerase sigma-70 factor (ECF subfamily)